MYRAKNYLRTYSMERMNACKEECIFGDGTFCDKDVFELCNIIIEEKNLQAPDDDPFNGVNLYSELRSAILEVI